MNLLDIWNGKPLPRRNTVREDIHFRIYDALTGEVLSFGTTNVLDVVTGEALRTQAEHPHARLVTVRFDGPAYK